MVADTRTKSERKNRSRNETPPTIGARIGSVSQTSTNVQGEADNISRLFNMEYLIRFAQCHETFRLPEIQSLATLAGVELEVVSYNDHVSAEPLRAFK